MERDRWKAPPRVGGGVGPQSRRVKWNSRTGSVGKAEPLMNRDSLSMTQRLRQRGLSYLLFFPSPASER